MPNQLNKTKTCCVVIKNKDGREDEFEAVPYEVNNVSREIVSSILKWGLEDFKAYDENALRMRVATSLMAFGIHLIGYNSGYAKFVLKRNGECI